MARGGRRNGQVGKAYGNRKDLQGAPRVATPSIPKVAPSGQYGEGARLQAAQSAVPMGAPNAPTAESPQSRPMPGMAAGAAGDYLRPTERPDQPLTAGIPSGPGVGPSPAAPLRPGEDVLPQLQAYYAAYPSEGLREMIEDIMGGNG